MDVKGVKKWCLYETMRGFMDKAKHAEKQPKIYWKENTNSRIEVLKHSD